MSEMQSKLQPPERQSEGKARCWYKEHLSYKKHKIIEGTPDRPEIVWVATMDKVTVWKLVHRDKKRRDFLMEWVGEQLEWSIIK